MATTTPNFGWAVPTSTDLVKDGAVAIETLGDAIDASLLDLKGGTTNQVLAKNSNTDMDFKWVADASGIPATILDAKGDLIAATAADTASRLAVGANGTVLTADSAEATGLKWATPASGGGMTLLSTTTLSGSSVTISSISQSYQTLLVYISAATSSADYQPRIIPNNTASICTITGTTFNSSQAAPTVYKVDQGDLIPEPTFLSSNTANAITCQIDNYASTTSFKTFNYYGGGLRYNSHRETFETSGLIRTTTAISSLVITTSGGGSFSAGTVLVYGVK